MGGSLKDKRNVEKRFINPSTPHIHVCPSFEDVDYTRVKCLGENLMVCI
jgi:hypothetical protein